MSSQTPYPREVKQTAVKMLSNTPVPSTIDITRALIQQFPESLQHRSHNSIKSMLYTLRCKLGLVHRQRHKRRKFKRFVPVNTVVQQPQRDIKVSEILSHAVVVAAQKGHHELARQISLLIA